MSFIKGIGHPAYVAKDYEGLKQFYIEVLGLKDAFTLKHDDGRIMLCYLHVAGHQFIELFPPPENGRDFTPPRSSSYNHLCLLVDDMDGLLADLREKGVEIDRGPQQGRDGNTQAWICDPEGNPIEFMQLNPESPQAKTEAKYSG